MKTATLLAVLVCLNRVATSVTQAQDTAANSLKPSLPELVSQLSDRDPNTRFTAGMALDRLGSNASPAVPVIGRLLEAEPEKVHDVMLRVVENCRSAAQPIIPILQRSLASSNANLRIGCARTLWVLDNTYAEAARAVAKRSLVETGAGVRVEAANLLWRMDKDAKEVVPTFAALLSDPETAFDYRAIKLLGQIGPPAMDAIPALKDWLKSKRRREAFITNAAVDALQRIQGAP